MLATNLMRLLWPGFSFSSFSPNIHMQCWQCTGPLIILLGYVPSTPAETMPLWNLQSMYCFTVLPTNYNRTRQNMYSLCFKLPNKVSLTLIANIMFKHSSMFKHATPSRLLSYPRSNWELPVSWWSSLFWPLIFQQNLVLQSKLRKQVEFAVRHPLPPGVKSHRFPSKNFLIIHQDGTYHQIKSSN